MPTRRGRPLAPQQHRRWFGNVGHIRDNMRMSTTARALRLIDRMRDDAAWRLLRTDNAPVIAAVLAEHLGDDDVRLDADELYERIDADLENLRGRGIALPLSARAYVASWRDAGFLVRRATEHTRGETLELSSAGVTALRFLDSRETPTRTLTESRLTTLSSQLRQLAIDTDPQSTRRLTRLHQERDEIDARISAIEEGRDEVLGSDRALERAHDLLAQATEVPDDFARVRAEFEELNAILRTRILAADDSQRDVLDDIFRGVNLIGDSDAGRSFSGFSRLVLDPAVGSAFEDDARQILDRDFARDLTPAQRRTLRDFLPTLKDRSAEIQTVITQFARGLRRYVRSQDYQTDRLLQAEIRDAMNKAMAAAQYTKPYAAIGVELDLSVVGISSIGAVSLHDPTDLDATGEVASNETAEASLADLRLIARETEIDFDELRTMVNSAIDDGSGSSVADVLVAHPATQGVASIVGLLALAAEYGEQAADATDRLSWQGADRVDRHARVSRYVFSERIP